MISAHARGARLVLAGLTLFFVGLGLGFAVTIFPAIKPLLSAHEGALGSGTFLISVGAIWSIYMNSASRILVPVIWLSHYALTATLILEGIGGAIHPVAGPLIEIACIAVTITTGMLIVKFWKAMRVVQ